MIRFLNRIQELSRFVKLIFGLSNRDVLFCINEKDGMTAWTSQITGKRGFGSIVDAGAALVLLTPAGNLIAFEPSVKEFKQLTSYKVADGDTTAYPGPGGEPNLRERQSLGHPLDVKLIPVAITNWLASTKPWRVRS